MGSGCDGTAHIKEEEIYNVSQKKCILILVLVMIKRVFENTCDRAGMLEKG